MRILVPIDFSTCSLDALESAIGIAKKIGGKIDILHSLDRGVFDQGIHSMLHFKEVRELRSHKLEEVILKYEKEDVINKYFLYENKFVSDIIEHTAESEYDLIVMGTHGISGKEEWFMGSNTQKVIRRLQKKHLIFKNPHKDFELNEVVFVTNLDREDLHAFKNFVQFVDLFDVKKIYVLKINLESFITAKLDENERIIDEFRATLKSHNHSFEFYSDYSVDIGLRRFIQNKKVDLIGISHLNRNPIKRIFLGSTVEMIVNHSEVPVLTIDGVE